MKADDPNPRILGRKQTIFFTLILMNESRRSEPMYFGMKADDPKENKNKLSTWVIEVKGYPVKNPVKLGPG